jgi:hypothetical protein
MFGAGGFAPAFGAANPLGAGGGKQGQTLLMRASALGLTSTVDKLLALGADVVAKNGTGQRAFTLARSLSLARALSLLLHAILFFLARYTIFEGQDVSIDTTCIPVQFTCNNVHVNIYAHMYVCV